MVNGKFESFISKHAIVIVSVLSVIGLVTVLIFIIKKPFNDWSFNPNAELFGLFGNFIGGFVGTIFSLVAIFLLFKTLTTQQESIAKQDQIICSQKKIAEYESFERIFFNLLKAQQDLTNSIKANFYFLDDNLNVVSHSANGKDFFLFSKNELKKIWVSINKNSYLGKYSDNKEYIDSIMNRIDDLFDQNSSSYIHPDYAKNNSDQIKMNEKLKHINSFYNISNNDWLKINEFPLENKIESLFRLFFQKYHYAIDQYFRHLHQIITFIGEFQAAEKDQREISKKYISFLQAQMSSFELMLLFYYTTISPKFLESMLEFNFFDHLTDEDLIDKTHNCIKGINLKSKVELLEFTRTN